jgi:hypothetical protein
VGTNDVDTTFYGVISNFGQGGSLAKVRSGVLTLQNNHCLGDTVGLILVSGSIINLDFPSAYPDVVGSLVVDGVAQPPGIYGGPMSGAPNILAEFEVLEQSKWVQFQFSETFPPAPLSRRATT